MRIWASGPPRSKCTSSIYAFIIWMPCPCTAASSDARSQPRAFAKSNPFLDPSRRWILRRRARSGSGRALLLRDLPDYRVRRHFPVPRGAPIRRRIPFPKHIAIPLSAASGGPPAARSLESCWASTSRFPEWKNENAFPRTEIGNSMLRSGFAFHSLANASPSEEMHHARQSALCS